MQVLVDESHASAARAASAAPPPTRPRSTACAVQPPTKASKTYRNGEFIRARIVATAGHDLVGVPV